LLELNVLLKSKLVDVDVLCLSENWLREKYIKLISIDKFKLANNFSRSKSNHGGSSICVKYHMQTKEINYQKGISKEKDFEMTAVEILDYKLIIMCEYRSPDGDFSTFLRSLKSVIQKVQARNKWLNLCGDHLHHKHQGLDPLIHSISRVTTVLTKVSLVFQLFQLYMVTGT
jgi:hypothetical protein